MVFCNKYIILIKNLYFIERGVFVYKVIQKNDYLNNKNQYLTYIKIMFENDSNKLANYDEISNHLDFIFASPYGNEAFLILELENDELISMINFYEYNNCKNEWCLFSLFTNQKSRRHGHGKNIMSYALKELEKYKCNKLISGIKSDNIPSIKLHELVGFKYANCNWDELAEGFPENHLGFIYESNEE